MENFDQPNDPGMAQAKDDSLQITPEVRLYWKETANWALFFAVLLFIAFGLASITGLVLAFTGVGGFIVGLFVVAFYGVVIFFPAYYYYLFSTKMKQALSMDNTALLDYAFVNLKRFYRFVGILIIVFLALFILIMLVFGTAMMRGGFPD